MAVCPLILNFMHISSQKWLVFYYYFSFPNFLPQLANFFTRIYPSYPWHFPTLGDSAVDFYKQSYIGFPSDTDWRSSQTWTQRSLLNQKESWQKKQSNRLSPNYHYDHYDPVVILIKYFSATTTPGLLSTPTPENQLLLIPNCNEDQTEHGIFHLSCQVWQLDLN